MRLGFQHVHLPSSPTPGFLQQFASSCLCEDGGQLLVLLGPHLGQVVHHCKHTSNKRERRQHVVYPCTRTEQNTRERGQVSQPEKNWRTTSAAEIRRQRCNSSNTSAAAGSCNRLPLLPAAELAAAMSWAAVPCQRMLPCSFQLPPSSCTPGHSKGRTDAAALASHCHCQALLPLPLPPKTSCPPLLQPLCCCCLAPPCRSQIGHGMASISCYAAVGTACRTTPHCPAPNSAHHPTAARYSGSPSTLPKPLSELISSSWLSSSVSEGMPMSSPCRRYKASLVAQTTIQAVAMQVQRARFNRNRHPLPLLSSECTRSSNQHVSMSLMISSQSNQK